MPFFEKQLTTEKHFTGKVISVRKDSVELSNGKTSYREVVEHCGGVAVVALEENGDVILVRQFRYPFNREILEIPAGKLEKGERPIDCAVRELSEETGCSAGRIIDLGEMYPSPGFCDEVLYIYLALELKHGEMHPDENELLDVVRMPLDELKKKIAANEIPDGKTVFGVLKASMWLDANK